RQRRARLGRGLGRRVRLASAQSRSHEVRRRVRCDGNESERSAGGRDSGPKGRRHGPTCPHRSARWPDAAPRVLAAAKESDEVSALRPTVRRTERRREPYRAAVLRAPTGGAQRNGSRRSRITTCPEAAGSLQTTIQCCCIDAKVVTVYGVEVRNETACSRRGVSRSTCAHSATASMNRVRYVSRKLSAFGPSICALLSPIRSTTNALPKYRTAPASTAQTV